MFLITFDIFFSFHFNFSLGFSNFVMVLYILLLFKYIFLALFYFRFSNFRTLYQLVESNPSFISALSIKKIF